MVWGGRRDGGSSGGPAPEQPDSWGLPVRRRCLMGLWGEPTRPPSRQMCHALPRWSAACECFACAALRRLVSLLMLCKLPISSLEFFSEKSKEEKKPQKHDHSASRSCRLTALWHPALQQGPSAGPSHPPVYLYPSSCAHSQRSGASNTHRLPASLSCVQSLCCLFTVLVNL